MTEPNLVHILRERVKELTALHTTSRLLHSHTRPTSETLAEIVRLLPDAWQYPDITVARICFQELEVRTPGFHTTDWKQRAHLSDQDPSAGFIEICYLEARAESAEGPFLAEERDLINSLAEILWLHLQHRMADEKLLEARRDLEEEVKNRTAELEQANAELQRLTLELSLAEARERREIAEDLHDHVGQALAFAKLRISQIQGDAVFSGFESSLEEVASLLDKTIAYTRSLTLQLSPPVLHEFGLAAAIEWLATQFQKEHGLVIKVSNHLPSPILGEQAVVLFKSIKELLTNIVRHAQAKRAEVSLSDHNGTYCIVIQDYGKGFDVQQWRQDRSRAGKFGLFSVMERARLLGGEVDVQSSLQNGTIITMRIPLVDGATHE